jgi:hypothetical protein
LPPERRRQTARCLDITRGTELGAGGPPVIPSWGSAVMATDKECEGYAQECVRLAGLTDDPEIREQLFQMAREWMAEAMYEVKMPKPRPRQSGV